MGWELVAQGDRHDLPNLGRSENYLPEGSRNLLELDLSDQLGEGDAHALEDALIDAGVPEVTVTANRHILRIYFTKVLSERILLWLGTIANEIINSERVFAYISTWELSTAVRPWLALAGIAAAMVAGIFLSRKGKT